MEDVLTAEAKTRKPLWRRKSLWIIAAVILVFVVATTRVYWIPSASMVPTLVLGDRVVASRLAYRMGEPQRGDILVFVAPKAASPDEREKLFIGRLIAVPGDAVRITPGYVIVGKDQFGHRELREALVSSREGKVKLTDGKVIVDGREAGLGEVAAALGNPKAKAKVVPGRVYLNGEVLDESYIAEDSDWPYPSIDTPRVWVTKDEDGNQVVSIPRGKLLVMGDNRNDSNDSRVWGLLDRRRVTAKVVCVLGWGERP